MRIPLRFYCSKNTKRAKSQRIKSYADRRRQTKNHEIPHQMVAVAMHHHLHSFALRRLVRTLPIWERVFAAQNVFITHCDGLSRVRVNNMRFNKSFDRWEHCSIHTNEKDTANNTSSSYYIFIHTQCITHAFRLALSWCWWCWRCCRLYSIRARARARGHTHKIQNVKRFLNPCNRRIHTDTPCTRGTHYKHFVCVFVFLFCALLFLFNQKTKTQAETRKGAKERDHAHETEKKKKMDKKNQRIRSESQSVLFIVLPYALLC